jgi:arginase
MEGIGVAVRETVGHLTREELDGFFIHLDADCLDSANEKRDRLRI